MQVALGQYVECITPARHAESGRCLCIDWINTRCWSLQFLYISKLALRLRSVIPRRDIINKERHESCNYRCFDSGVMVMPAAHDLAHRDHAVQEMSLIEAVRCILGF